MLVTQDLINGRKSWMPGALILLILFAARARAVHFFVLLWPPAGRARSQCVLFFKKLISRSRAKVCQPAMMHVCNSRTLHQELLDHVHGLQLPVFQYAQAFTVYSKCAWLPSNAIDKLRLFFSSAFCQATLTKLRSGCSQNDNTSACCPRLPLCSNDTTCDPPVHHPAVASAKPPQPCTSASPK